MSRKRIFCFLTVLLLLASAVVLPISANTEDAPVLKYQYKPTLQGKNIIDNPEDSPLYGLSAIFLGDSICYSRAEQLVEPTTAGWAGRIGTTYEMDWENLGSSGGKVTASYDNNLSQQLFPKNGNDYDLIMLQGGINDAYVGAPLGSISDKTDLMSFNTSTYAGSLEQLLAFARKYFPEATVVYLIHHTTPNSLNTGDLSQKSIPKGNPQDYVDLTKAICEKWEVPYLNLYDDETFNTRTFDTANNSTGCMWPDLLHLSKTGYDVLNPYIVSFLESVLLREDASEFLACAEALSTELTPEERFTAIRGALLAYSELSDLAKDAVEEEYDLLLWEIEEYNETALEINEIAAAACDVAVIPLQKHFDFLTGLWYTLRTDVTAEFTEGGDAQ